MLVLMTKWRCFQILVEPAMENAVSIASTASTMGALVVDVPEPEIPVPAMGGGMGGMY